MAGMSNVTTSMVTVKSKSPETACWPTAIALPGPTGPGRIAATMRGNMPLHKRADVAVVAPLPGPGSPEAVIDVARTRAPDGLSNIEQIVPARELAAASHLYAQIADFDQAAVSHPLPYGGGEGAETSALAGLSAGARINA